MYKKIRLISVFVLLLLFASVTASAEGSHATTITVVEGSSVSVGNEFVVYIDVENGGQAAGGSMNIVYDSDLLKIVDYEKGAAFGSVKPNVNTAYGKNTIRLNWFSPSALTSDRLITLKFEAIEAGTAEIRVESVKLATVNADAVEAQVTNASVTVIGAELSARIVLNNDTDSEGNAVYGDNTALAKFVNMTDSDEYYTVCIAQYSGDTMLCALVTDIKATKGVTTTQDLGFEVGKTSNRVKVYVWKKGTMVPFIRASAFSVK